MKRKFYSISVPSLLFVVASTGFAADSKNILTCDDPATGILAVSDDGQNIKLETEFTYQLFDKIFKILFPEEKHIPGDKHEAALTLTAPLGTCQGTAEGEGCILDPPGGTFATDILGTRRDVLLQGVNLQKAPDQVQVTILLVRNGRPATGMLEFPPLECH